MQAVQLTSQGLQLVERAVPEPGPGQVLVRTVTCGVCEGDLFHYRQRDRQATPVVMGHEGSGVIAAVGEGVFGWAVGERVSANAGAFAEYFVARPEQLVRVPDTLDLRDVLAEPLACCVHAADRFGMRLGDSVAVVGCGFMGLTCLQLALLRGAAQITAIEPISWRREMALQLGASQALAPDDLPPPESYDVVIEATGVPSGVDLASDLVRQHGRIVLVGYHQSYDGMRTVNMKQWNFKAIDVINGHVRRENEKLWAAQAAVNLLAAGRLQSTPLITHYPLADAAQAFQDLDQRKQGLYKVALDVN